MKTTPTTTAQTTPLPTWRGNRIHWSSFFQQFKPGDTVILPIEHRNTFSSTLCRYRYEFGCTTQDLGNGTFKATFHAKGSKPEPSGPPTWSLHIGHIKLYITGPAEHQWFSVSAAYYRGAVGTQAERQTAQQVVEHLNRYHRQDHAIDRPAIDKLLRRFSPSKLQPI